MDQPTDVASAPLVGRQRELERIARALARDDCQGVALIGPAGVGKTRLADECRRLATSAGMAVVAASANAASARLALGALAHLLPPASALADLHQDLQPAQLLQSARAALAERAGDRPLVISIDDAHHLDGVAAHLVHHLTAERAAFVVLTVRSGETVPAPISALWKDGFVERIDLAELGEDDVRQLAHGLLGASLDTDALVWLTRTSAGNALFVRELVLAGREDGTLRLDGGRWRLAGGRRTESPRLAELLTHRLEGLDSDERRAVEMIALAEPIGLELVEELVGDECLEQLDRRGLVRIVADGRRLGITLSHPLYVEAIRRGAMTIRRRSDLGSVAAAVTARGARRREDAVRIAGWQLARGGRADPEVVLRAAMAALLSFDDHAAIELATAGLAQQPDQLLTAELHLCRGLAKNRLGRFDDAYDDHVQAAAEAVAPEQISSAAVRLAATVLERHGDLPGALQVLDDAIARLGDDEHGTDVRLERATLLADAGLPRAARAEIERVRTTSLDVEQRVLLALAVGSEHLGAGRPVSAVKAADAGLHEHLSNVDAVTTYHPSSHFLPRILGLIDQGRFDTAVNDSEFLRARSEAERRTMSTTGGKIFVSMVLLRQGRARSCLALITDAIDTAGPQLPAYMLRTAWAIRAQAHIALGDLAAARSAMEELRRRGEVVDGFGAIEVALAPVRLAQAEGRPADGASLLWSGVSASVEHGNLRVGFALLDELVHVHHDEAAARRLIELAPSGEGELLQLLARAALLLADGPPSAGALADLAEAFADVGMHLRAAELAARAVEVARRDGDQRGATRHLQLVAAEQAKCEGAVSVLTAGASAVVPLTDREREIAVMVGRGASSKDVAAVLFLSARTVDNHLQRIYSKLGVSNRRELAVAIGVSSGS